MPVNMPTHGHGQGYADINFMIPELIQSVNVRKGPYFADVGDFGSAGSVAIDYINRLPKNIAGDDQRHIWLSPRAGGGVDGGRCRHAARGGRGRQIQRPVGRAGQCAQDQRRAALQPGHRHRRLYAVGDGLFQRLEFDRSGGAARDRPEHHRPVRLARSDRWRRRRAASRCRAIGRNRANTGRARSTPMRSTRRCGSTTISPTSSTIPSMAISSARWTGARSMASMPATPSMCASAASRRRPASGCRRAATISGSACSRHCSARRSRPCAKTV